MWFSHYVASIELFITSSKYCEIILKFETGVGIGETMSGKEFGVNQKFKMAARGSFP
jgi:hypothetical protein